MVWDFPHYRGICGCLKSHAHFFFHTAMSQLRLFLNVLLRFYFFTPPSSAWCTFSMQRLYKLLKDGSPKWCVFVLTINLLKKKSQIPLPFLFFNFPLFFKFDVETNWVVGLDNKITLMFIFDSTCALFSILILPWISCHGKACKTGIILLLDTATGITRSWQECGTYLILKSLKM